jgi:hypothetical protein
LRPQQPLPLRFRLIAPRRGAGHPREETRRCLFLGSVDQRQAGRAE